VTVQGANGGYDDFFSYQRFAINVDVISKVSNNNRTRQSLRDFAKSFMDGIFYLSGGYTEKAKEELFKARRLWPEYFGPDFLIALTLEQEGDLGTAARFYKSYLQKLRNFHVGKYRISGPIIIYLSKGEIERYRDAEYLVEEHLRLNGIDIDKVRPAVMTPFFLLYALLTGFFVVIYVLIVNMYLPYVRKRHKLKNPPEGYWVCANCSAIMPDLANECTECRRPR